jgi:hypothetical protein
MLELSD